MPDGRSAPEALPVVRVITRLNIGGPSRQALALTRRLAPRWRTRLVAGAPAAHEGELLDPAVAVTRVPLVREISPFNDARALFAVRDLLARDRPVIVHTHMAKAGTVGRLAASMVRPRARTVHTFHGHVLDSYFSARKEWAFLQAERFLARRTDILVAVSEEIRTQLLELGIGDPSRFRTIPLGLDLAEHRSLTAPPGTLRADIGVSAGTPLVGTVGRLVPIKDHETLLRAIARIPDVHLAIVGDGELRGQLEALTDRLGLARRVHFTGWRLDIPVVMADLDLAVLSSRNEGTPVSLIEAAACARATVATDVGGVRSVVIDGKTGLLVPAQDPGALASAIVQLLGDDQRRSAMGAAGRRESTRFDEQRLVADIGALYEELSPSAG